MNTVLQQAIDALEGVIRVADRKTDEFDRAREAVAALRIAMEKSQGKPNVETYRIHAAHNGLDPITVFVENFEPGKGRIIIHCYARAWTAYWGAMSGRTLQEFFVDADTGYILGNLRSGWQGLVLKKYENRDDGYLARIVEAVKDEFLRCERKDGHAKS